MNEHSYTCFWCGRAIKNRHYGPDGNYYGASCITKYTIPFSPAREETTLVPPKKTAEVEKLHSSDDTQVFLTDVTINYPRYFPPVSSKERVLWRWKKLLPEYVWFTAAFEGNTFTLPEVITLLEGAPVHGRNEDEKQQIFSLQKSCNYLAQLISTNSFMLTKHISDTLHGLVAKYEAIESGHFRGEGTVTGGGAVRTSKGTIIPGTDTEKLPEVYQQIIDYVNRETDPMRKAITYFICAVRHQLYFDGNTRTARLMLNGILLSHNMDAIVIPYTRKIEFNNALDELFINNDGTSLAEFLISCHKRIL